MSAVDALRNLQDAIDEEARAKRIIVGWSRACGPGIWREGHPLDRMKVDRLKEARWRVREAQWIAAEVLRQARPEGCA
jgi:hypothetical protein